MQINNLEWLQKYYLECCNGDWEHTYGIKINNIDNPGWALNIDLQDTMLEEEIFKEVTVDRSEHNWYFCRIIKKQFQARGGPENLTEMISVFRQWVEEVDQKIAQQEKKDSREE